MSEWIKCEDRLPELDTPIWLYQKEIPNIFVGERSDGDEGWQWCRCYSAPFFGPRFGWKSNNAEWDDDYQPTHWMPLPEPPAPE